MQTSLIKYLSIFKKLRIDKAHGIAPHKPIMLLSVLQSFLNQDFTGNRIYITPELVALFKTNWNLLVTTKHDCVFALPFYHLESDKFWHLQANPGFENFLQIKSSMRKFSNLNATVDYAFIDDDFRVLALDKVNNKILQEFLLDEYFPNTKTIEDKILHENADIYKAEIKNLIKQNLEEDVFIRSCVFKREVPKLYNYSCCVSGMKIDSIINVSMVDACHIVPFSESYDDTITNGIALCPNLHGAFDRGLISIGDNYEVIVKSNFSEKASLNYFIVPFHGKRISLPIETNNYPSLENFYFHRKKFKF